MEVILALMVFTIVALLTAALIPMSAPSVRYGNGSLPTVSSNANGSRTGSASFTDRDELDTYFVGGVSEPKGTVEIAPFAPSRHPTTGAYSVIEATVTVAWRDVRGRQQSFATKTFVTRQPIL